MVKFLNESILNNKSLVIYAIIAFITVPFFIFVLPRITQGLHPGSGSEDNIGPVISGQCSIPN